MSDHEHLLENIYCYVEDNNDTLPNVLTNEDLDKYNLKGFGENGLIKVSDETLLYLFNMCLYCMRQTDEVVMDLLSMQPNLTN